MPQSDKTKLLLAVGVGLILSDIVPTPADGLYFHIQQKNKEKLERKEITPSQYWTRDAIFYYALNPLWWCGVVGASMYFGKTYEQKRNIGLSLIAGGVVLGVLAKNIKKDEKFYSENIMVKK